MHSTSELANLSNHRPPVYFLLACSLLLEMTFTLNKKHSCRTPLSPLEHRRHAGALLLESGQTSSNLQSAAENLFALSSKNLIGYSVQHAFTHTEQLAAADAAGAGPTTRAYSRARPHAGHASAWQLHLRCAATPLQSGKTAICCWNFHPMDRPAGNWRAKNRCSTRPRLNRLLLPTWRMKIKKPAGRDSRRGAICWEQNGEARLA